MIPNSSSIVLILVSVLGVILCGLCTFIGTRFPTSNKVSFTSTGPTIERVQALGELVVLRVSIGDVLVGKTADYKGSWLIKGDGLLSVDMRQAEVLSCDESARRIVVELPAPRVIQPRVDHSRTESWEIRKTSWVPFRGDPDVLRDNSMAEAQLLVEHSISKEETIELAKAQTVLMLRVMYQFLDWDVEVVWASDEATSDHEKDSNEFPKVATTVGS